MFATRQVGLRITLAMLVVAACTSLSAQEPPRKAVAAKAGMVVCVSPPAAQVGVDVLKKGGNAVDAAVAVALAMAVTHPSAGNIGGGGFMLIHPSAGKGNPTVIEYREKAPAAATVDMFAKERDSFSHRAVGVPGTVRGLELAFQRHGSGKIEWSELVKPAIELATNGWTLEPWSARSLNRFVRGADKHPEAQRVFRKPSGEPWKAGEVLKQPDLAKTLQRVAEQGADGFYGGETAQLVEEEMKRGGGLITVNDLCGYQAVEREPIRGTYRGYDVFGASPPSSGGIGVVEMLNMLECFDMKSLGPDSAERWHITAEVMRRSFLDRARHLGDPDFTKIPGHLITKEHAKSLAAGVDRDKATLSASLAPDIVISPEPEHTTHFSIVDDAGMAVSNTYTLEETYGSKIVVRGAGFLLNDEMLDFNPIPGVTTPKGKIGTPANQVAPQKRMLSSMTPIILAKDGKPLLVTGSPGGRTIINTVVCVVTNVVDYGMEVQSAVDFPRLHHQWFPDEIKLEQFRQRSKLVNDLERLGHKVVAHASPGNQGDAHTIWIDADGTRHGAADRRLMGKAAGY